MKDNLQIKIKNMNNIITELDWIQTIIADMPDSFTTTIEIFVKAWSVYENKDNNWISHFLEHMFFKGWKKYDNPMKVAQALDWIGWEFNAYTSDDYAGYYVKSAPEYISTSFDVLSDMLVNAQFPADELEREKWVIIQEIMMYEDLPQKLVYDKWKKYYYWDNCFWWSTLWTIENIKKFEQKDFFEHKESLYTKDNLLIVVAGKIPNIEELKSMIVEYFGKLPKSKKILKPKFEFQKPDNNMAFFDKNTEQNHLIISAEWFSINKEELYAANLLWVILWWNMSSRLFQEIREKQWLCYYISWSHYAQEEEWLFFIRAWLEKARFEFWLKAIYEEISKIADGKITQQEFEKSLWYKKWKTQMWIETSDQMSDFLWDQYFMKWNIESLETILSKYEKLTLDDIKNVASKLKVENLYSFYIK